jgi:hypothetical protein
MWGQEATAGRSGEGLQGNGQRPVGGETGRGASGWRLTRALGACASLGAGTYAPEPGSHSRTDGRPELGSRAGEDRFG